MKFSKKIKDLENFLKKSISLSHLYSKKVPYSSIIVKESKSTTVKYNTKINSEFQKSSLAIETYKICSRKGNKSYVLDELFEYLTST